MNPRLKEAIQQSIAEATSRAGVIVRVQAVHGGCINQACAVHLDDGRCFFVKSNPDAPAGMFQAEWAGLQALSQQSDVKVARPLVVGECQELATPFLVIEHIASGRRAADFSEGLGCGLAQLHQNCTADHFGFNSDNYLGSAPQQNHWSADWCQFWREHRLGFQLRWARQLGHSTETLDRLGQRLLDRLDQWIAQPDEPPTLLHGDLWSGNVMVDRDGQAVLIDPAVYYGRREAELAMTQLFGGFDREFFEAYHQQWPLSDGYQERIEIYQLYHRLNHLNLFGSGYLAGCLETVRRFS